MVDTDKLAWALAWASRGFKVFPIVEGTKDQPMVPFTQEATTDPVQITRWWRDPLTGIHRNHNIGVLTSGLAVIDVDNKPGRPGLANYYALGGTFDTLTVRTPSGGFHAYHNTPREIANEQWKDSDKAAMGIDPRGYHGYVVGPGSVADGKAYEVWIDKPLSPVPAAILARCRAPGERPAATGTAVAELDTPTALAGAQGYVLQVPGAPEGDRSGACFRLACQLRDRGVSEATAAALVVEHWIERCHPPFDRGEAIDVVAHAYSYAQNAEGAKSIEADFAHVTGNLPPPPAIAVDATPAAPDDAWCWGNIRPLSSLKPRPFVVDRILLRGEITALVAASGVGKSQLLLTMAILLALGRPVLGLANRIGKPAKSLIYNAEDSREEMEKRYYATCTQMNVDPELVRPCITLVSGKEIRIKLVNSEGGRPVLNAAMVQRLVNYASDPDCVFVGMDPLISLHDIDENLNTQMRYVLETILLIAEQAQVAIGLAVHTGHRSSAKVRSYAGDADAGRGAMTIRDTSRVLLTLAPPTDDDMDRNDIPQEEFPRLLRVDDGKMNYGLLSGQPIWLRKHTVQLHTGDAIAAFESFDMRQAGESNRYALGCKIAQELVADMTADISLSQMAARLCSTDPLYDRLPPELVAKRLDRILAVGIDTPLGGVGMVQRHGRKCVGFV